MGVSSFCGCCSLKSGALIIGILHLICPLILEILIGLPYSPNHWSLLYIALTCFSVMFIFGIITRNVECVFPFVSMHFIIVLMFIYNTVSRFIRDIHLIYQSKDEAFVMIFQITTGSLMYYFFIVVYAFYQELLHDKFTSLVSVDNRVKFNGVSNSGSIAKDCENHPTMEKNPNGEVFIQCCADSKKPIL